MSRHEDLEFKVSSTQAVRLVAGREIRTRLRSKAYRITTLALMLMVIAFAVIMQLVNSRDDAKHVGFTTSAAGLEPAVTATAKSRGTTIEAKRVRDEKTGRQQVSDGKLDALVVGTDGARMSVVVRKLLDEDLKATLTAAAGQAALTQQIITLGGDPAKVAAAIGRASVDVDALSPSSSFDPQRLAVGSIAGILIYLALITTGASVAQGVVEEKSTRVVELLLATIRPWQLMAGKVVGIGLIGLLQVAAVAISGVVAGEVTGALSLSLSTSVSVVAWVILWFVLGFTMYALVFAGLGALVSRQEDVAGVTAPATMLLVVGYVVGISVLPSSPDNPVVNVMSLLPVFSPTLMPMRLAMGEVPVWQTILALVLAVATVPLLVSLSGRIYRNGVVRTGARLSLREAVRTS